MNIAKTIKNSPTTCIKQSTCPYCGVGCGVDISLNDGVPSNLTGSPEHPANFGRLCIKGTNLLDTIDHQNRLLEPLVDGVVVDWETAAQAVATKLSNVIKEHGKDAVAFYVSGQLLTEDYYVANKLMKGYIGSGNIDTNSRLCMSSAVAAYKRAFGEDVVPCSYEDIEQTDLMILVGSNAAFTHPVLYQRLQRAKQIRPDLKVVVIDPRRTDSVTMADMFIDLKPGTDAALYGGLLKYLAENNGLDNEFIDNSTDHFDIALSAAAQWSISEVAAFCQLKEEQVLAFYQCFTSSKRVISFYSMGINQSSSGVDKCQSIINAHLASGKILKSGSGPFSITGQPNAMGGREVGGLANQLTAHMDIDNPGHRDTVQRFWDSPSIATKAGAKAVDMFGEIGAGNIKAVWIMATNPMVSMPDRNAISEALEKCECVIVSDCVASNDTLEFADIKLPATGWIEKDGTVTNAERRISRQRGILGGPRNAKHDWQIICDVAKKMGFSGFDFTHPHQIFSEWAALTGFENSGQRQLDISLLADISETEYNALAPIQWPHSMGSKGQVFRKNRFSTENGRAKFLPIQPKLPAQQTCAQFPFVINSGRIRDHWHTMTRTGKSAKLSAHTARPMLQIHPADAARLDVTQDNYVRARSTTGTIILQAEVSEAVRQGECFVPIHWNRQFASSANVNNLYASVFDPLSGQPESKHAAVQLERVNFQQTLHLFVQNELEFEADFWVKSKLADCIHYQIAHLEPKQDACLWSQQITKLNGQWLSFSDGKQHNLHCIDDNKIIAVAFIDEHFKAPPLDWINSLFADQHLDFPQISALLQAAPEDRFTLGKQVCTCFKVHEKTIVEAIEKGCGTAEELGAALKCGTNCGSCRTDLSRLIQVHKNSQTKIEIEEVF